MALRRPCASQRATKPALVGLLNNAMSVSHILGVMSCKWPNFTAATAFEIQPRGIFFARSAEVGRWVSGFGVSMGLKWVGGLRVSGFNHCLGSGLGGERNRLWMAPFPCVARSARGRDQAVPGYGHPSGFGFERARCARPLRQIHAGGRARRGEDHTSIENGTLGSIRYTGATISKRSALKMYLRPYE